MIYQMVPFLMTLNDSKLHVKVQRQWQSRDLPATAEHHVCDRLISATS